MEQICKFLFVDHWVASLLLLPWFSVIWTAGHGQWAHLAMALAYLELVGGPFALLK